jgi:hypothetical protein
MIFNQSLQSISEMDMSYLFLFFKLILLILKNGTLIVLFLPVVFAFLRIGILYHDSRILKKSITNTEVWTHRYLQHRPKKIRAFHRNLLAIKVRESKHFRFSYFQYIDSLFVFFSYIFTILVFFIPVFLYIAQIIEILEERMILMQIMHTFVLFVFYFYVVVHDSKILEMSHSESIVLICQRKLIPTFFISRLRLVKIDKFFNMEITCILEIFFKNMCEFFRDKQYDRECPICVKVCELKVTACGHCFCNSCLFNINMKNCPNCRKPIDLSKIRSLCDVAKTGGHVYN